MIVTASGCYTMSADQYHADPCPEPSLSSSIARLLLDAAPLHAYHAHPRLGAGPRRESDAFDLGTACHAYVLEGAEAFTVVQATDWRSKAAQAARTDARATGKVALLEGQWERVKAMRKALLQQLAQFDDGGPHPLGAGGQPELTLVWQERGVWCRARPDWLHADRLCVDDLKTRGETASPEAFCGALYREGYDVQAAFYLRGVRSVFGTDAIFRFVVVEHEPPYAVSVVGLDPMALDFANRKVDRALTIWRECLDTGEWPGYPTTTCWAEAPAWAVARWEEREARERMREDGRALSAQLMGEA